MTTPSQNSGTTNNDTKSVFDRNYVEKFNFIVNDRDKYRFLFENSNDALFIIDLEGNILEVNQEACYRYGYSKKQFIGMNINQIDLQTSQQEITKHINTIAELKKNSFQTIHTTASGETLYTQVNALLLTSDSNTRIFCSCRNISELKRTQMELYSSQGQIQSIIRTVPCGLGVSKNRIIQYANDTLLKMLKYETDELAFQSTRILYPDDQEYDRIGFDLYTQIEKFGQGSTETIFKCKNGDLIDILLTSSFLDQNDPDKGITFAATDISKQKALAAALEKRILALTQPLENIGNISFHDLFNLDDIQKIQDHFASSTGVASIITDIDGNPITKPSNFCRLCNDIIRKTEKGCANCHKSDAALGRVCSDGPTIQPCLSGGLWDAGASITVGGKHIANWLIGQVRDQSQSEEKIAAYARQIGADVDETISAFSEVTQMSFEKFQTISQTLYLLAKQLSDSAYQNIQQARFIAESKKNHQIINNYNETLRNEVERQTRKLAQANQQLNKIIEEQKLTEAQLRDTHEHLVQSEKLASIGQLAAGVAHEINSPLGAIASSNTAIRDNFEDITFALHEMTHIFASNVELTHRLLHYIMIHEESVISTRQQRQLRMTIAQELKGKASIDLDYLAQFIVNAGLTDCYEQFLPLFNNKDSDKYLESIQKITYIFQATRVINQAINQSSRIVFALREYAHSNESERKQLANIKHSLETAITLYANKLKHGVELLLNFKDTPDIACFPGELNQVWTNLIHNAVQAMEGKGILRISLDHKDNMIEVTITDSGTGIPDEIKDKIFTPLFTTKPAGMGTGLGLDIVNRIIKRHNGTISFNSVAGQGASFTVKIPVTTST